MGTRAIRLPYSSFVQFNSSAQAGLHHCGEETDNRSPLVKTKPGRWRAPTAYTRTIVSGTNRSPMVNLRVDFSWPGNPKSYATFAGATQPSGWYTWNSSLPSFPASMTSRCEVKALKRLKDSNVNVAVSFAERGRTADMLTESVSRLRKGVKAARRLDPGGISDALGLTKKIRNSPRGRRKPRKELSSRDPRVQDLWLEYQYGWLPLLSDSEGLISELARNDLENPDRYRCTVIGKEIERSQVETVVKNCTCMSSNLITFDFRERMRLVHKCKVRLDFSLANPALAQAAAMGLTNPLEVAWELVPFSFVADWFIPIGSYLSALDATVGWDFKGGSLSRVTKVNKRGRPDGKIFFNSIHAKNQTATNGSPFSTYRRSWMNRTVYASSPLPWLPSLDGDLTRGQRFNNALALLAQAFR